MHEELALDEADDFLLHCNDLRKLQHCTFFGETIMMSCHGKTPPIWAELSVMSDQTKTELKLKRRIPAENRDEKLD